MAYASRRVSVGHLLMEVIVTDDGVVVEDRQKQWVLRRSGIVKRDFWEVPNGVDPSVGSRASPWD
jgi:hypothetical protein